MTSLITCIGEDKGTTLHVKKVIEEKDWDSIFILGYNKQDAQVSSKKTTFIHLDKNKFLPELIEDIISNLKGKIKDTEVALNIISGNGKLHMALLSALLKSGLAIRLIALTKEGVKEI